MLRSVVENQKKKMLVPVVVEFVSIQLSISRRNQIDVAPIDVICCYLVNTIDILSYTGCISFGAAVDAYFVHRRRDRRDVRYLVIEAR